MTLGRTPLPTATKQLRGNPGKRALNDREPKPPPGNVEMPAWLSLVDEQDGLAELSKTQLRRRAKEAGVERYSRLTVAELIDALRARTVTAQEEAWRRLAPVLRQMQVLTKADETALALLVDVYVEYLELREVVRREGRSYETYGKSGRMVRARPEVAMQADAWRRVVLGMREFGLTPAARSRIKVEAFEDEDPMDGLV